jgi:hypothetical protein
MSSSLARTPARSLLRLLFMIVAIGAALAALALPGAAHAAGYVYERSWGSTGAMNGQFINPMFVCTDPYGYVYVSDKGNDRIEKFRKDGLFVRAWGTTGALDGQFNNPQGLCYDPADDLICVVDYDNHNVQEFTRAGVWVRTFGATELLHPVALCYNSVGDLVVTDSSGNNAEVYDTDGTYVGSLFDGNVTGPRGIACDPVYGEYYIASAGDHEVRMFDVNGVSDGAFGSVTVMGQVALDRDGNVLVADWSSGVSMWAPDGTFIRDVVDTRPNVDTPSLSGSWGVATAIDGSVYIANYTANRIDRYVFDTTPPTVTDDYDHEWHSESFALNLSAIDDWTDVIDLDISGLGWSAAPVYMWITVDAVDHTDDGVSTYTYSARDAVGNESNDSLLAIKIDTRAPVTTVSGVPASWVHHDVTLALAGSDRGSGVAGTVYSTDGGTIWPDLPDSGLLTIGAEGDNAVQFYSWDGAVPTANTESTQAVHVLIDKTAPTPFAAHNVTVVRGRTATFMYLIKDNLSPKVTAKILIKKGTKVVKTIDLGSVTPSLLLRSKAVVITLPVYAKYRWVVVARDLAGNTRTSAALPMVVK